MGMQTVTRRTTLRLPDLPGGGKNAERLYTVVSQLMPKNGVTSMVVFHDNECPCNDGAHSMAACTCDRIDVELCWEQRAANAADNDEGGAAAHQGA